ncbi:MAG: Crp/Fnr family transcriptional regulator [Brevundimonas sp.]|nr:Crp/Fnr family transcriptional regulator [Brevundimonas sp.]
MFDAAAATGASPAEPSGEVAGPPEAFAHPLLALMPERLQARLRECGQVRELRAGERLAGRPVVGFVQQGALALVEERVGVSVEMHGAGSIFGWETCLSVAVAPPAFLAVLPTRWIEAPSLALNELMGEAWMEHVFARHALDRLARIQADAACNAVHQVPQRAADWIQALCRIAGPELRTTQAILARALGVQRTSVNAAMKLLERDGAVRLSRGRLLVLDPDRLAHSACGCRSASRQGRAPPSLAAP